MLVNKEVCHMEINEPHVWTLAVLYIKRALECMRRVESGTTLDNMAWYRRHGTTKHTTLHSTTQHNRVQHNFTVPLWCC